MIVDTKEKTIISKLAANKRESTKLAEELAEYRKVRADHIRHLYFDEKKKQTKIATDLGMAQGSVSRIIAGYSCANVANELRG